MSTRFWAMFSRLRREAMRANGDERGMVLANVIIFGTVLMIVVAGVLAVSTSGAVKSAADRNYQNAMAATYAGLADYQSKISINNGYAVYGNASSQFSKASGSLFQGDGNGNVAFTTSGSTWAPVAGTTDEFFRYEVDNSNYASQGILKVRVTGKSGGSTRTLVANLRGDGFINYLYFTNYESAEPAITGDSCNSNYQWQTGVSNTCGYVQFAKSDTLNGPVRTNDTFTSCGATFNGSVESHSNSVNKPSGCTASTFNGGQPSAAAYLGLPALNANMSQEARTDLPNTVPRPGCLYTGPTTVQFNGDGTMTVNSPWTKATEYTVNATTGAVSASSNSAAAAALCGSISALQSAAGATIPTLPTNLMYVQDVPSSNSPTNVNYWASGTYPSAYTNTYCNTTVTVKTSKGVTTATNSASTTYSNGQGYPANNEWINAGSVSGVYRTGSASSVYSCTAGDVFVSGGFSGAMTIASSGTIWVTDNITYVNQNTDILGLVGQNAVEVYNPAKCSAYYIQNYYGTQYCQTPTLLNRSGGESLEIDAAIAANAGTFWNENYNFGKALGTLTVKGSIAQNWRGIVATGGSTISTGFSKNYVYDNRLLTTAPPKFLQPVSTSYGVTTQVETQPAYNANGSCATTSAGVCR